MSEIQKGSEIIDCGNSCERRGNQCPFWGWDAGYFQTFITKCRLKNKLNGKVVVPEEKWLKIKRLVIDICGDLRVRLIDQACIDLGELMDLIKDD